MAGSARSDLTTSDVGCLLVADITGYTTYLMGSELDHAQDVLADLMETVVGALRPAFHLSKLEGDAAFCYALTERIGGTMLLDTIDACYFAFRSRLRDVDRATTCDCNACILIPQLDLKVVAHHGRFARRQVAGNEELTGRDVIVVHRLLKNHVAELVGTRAYAFLSADCVDAMDLEPETLGYVPHSEAYQDVGQINGFVGDLERRWQEEQERRRVFVAPDDAAFEFVGEVLPFEPAVVWEYLTAPEKRVLWQADELNRAAGTGRRGVGDVNHCVHGKGAVIERILDWRPFTYYTASYDFPLLGPWPWTCELTAVDGGTQVRIRGRSFSGPKRVVATAFGRKAVTQIAAQQRQLRGAIEADLVDLAASSA